MSLKTMQEHYVENVAERKIKHAIKNYEHELEKTVLFLNAYEHKLEKSDKTEDKERANNITAIHAFLAKHHAELEQHTHCCQETPVLAH